jgi:large subunit ribosomal protein L25
MTVSNNIAIHAIARNDLGKGASRRLRRNAGLVPAIIYGGSENPQSIAIAHKDLSKATENEAFFSSVLDIDIDGKTVPAILKDLQRHPAKPLIMHADFQRVDMKKKIHINVPLHFINEEQSPGIKLEGGRVQHNMVEVEVSCLPGNLPEYIEVDMAGVHLGDIIHISDLVFPAGVESIALQHGADHDLPVASLFAPRGVEAEDEEEGPAATDEEA